MVQIQFAIYEPPEKGMPFLAVRIDGVKTKFKKVIAIAARTRADAEAALGNLQKDMANPYWREQASLEARYAPKPKKES
jgi:hypothetical protein